ncbi:AEC family transporter [Ammoniphilus sp. CFH 90114]|uniref:AEC family transporter n=1 Tax=Ammoniphilus sp. CFH 90114 TaxID=2493665 RepID=UPI00100E7157|nr:AEC family transporter [Ammoniphilus sp. CFH 90114]RXT04173.1 AEC family transporter [Ammoniphilus sp. CFH 90114]
MEFSSVFQSILVMGAMIGVGCLLSRHITWNEDTRTFLIQIIVNIAMPCIILASIFQFPIDQDVFKQIAIIFLISVVINVLGIGLGWILARMMNASPQKAKEMAILSGLGNTGFIGLPLCAALFGPKGALLAAVFDAGLDFTIWTVGVIMLQKHQRFSFSSLKSMVNIPMIAIVVGLFIAYLNVQPPQIFITLTENLAHLASPLAMIYIGLLVPSLWKKKKQIHLPQLGLPIVCKLLLFPVLTVLFLHLFTLEMDVIQVVLVQSTMPTITVASILFAKYAADEEMGAAATVFSTLISLSTIPVMVYVLSHFV